MSDGGTSLAAPHVSGVVALMLSVNPNLTPYKIRNILRSTAIKINPNIYTYDSNGWNEQVGYGLVDAHKAVLNSLFISGSTIPCDNSVYSISNLPSSYTVTWSWQTPCGPILQQNTPSTNMCTLDKNGYDYIKNTIVATIKKNGTTLCTLKKPVNTGQNFSGYYAQAAHQYTNWYYPGTSNTSFGSGETIYLYRGSTITLTSSKFVGATLSYSGTTPLGWTHNGNTVSFHFSFRDINDPYSPRYTQSPASLTITGTNPTSCECFRFTV
jgi:Subtilase family.